MSSTAATPTPLVQLQGIAKEYPGPPVVRALRDINIEIHRGESVAIRGRSGSGKSTLLHVLGLLDRPSTGVYLLDGMDIASLSDRDRSGVRAQKIGFVFQAFHLLSNRSVLENVMLADVYGCRDRPPLRIRPREQRARDALERVGLADRADFRATEISGGQRQRVAIARAIVRRPPLLLCDEPTGNLDSDSAEEILTIFEELCTEGHTIVTITHDDDVARRMQRRLHIHDGYLGSMLGGIQ